MDNNNNPGPPEGLPAPQPTPVSDTKDESTGSSLPLPNTHNPSAVTPQPSNNQNQDISTNSNTIPQNGQPSVGNESTSPNNAHNGNDDHQGHDSRRNPQHQRRPRTSGARLFVGNLKSEEINKEEFRKVFEKYGEVIEVSIHRSFGFVQFADANDLDAAMQAEQGRMIGNKPIDLQRAKDDSRRNTGQNRRDNRGRDNRGQGRDNRNNRGYRDNRDRDRFDNRDRRGRGRSRERSPGRDRNRREDNDHRRGSPKDVTPPKNGMVVKLILLGEQQRNFAEQVCSGIREIGVPYEIGMLDGRTLGQALRDAEENKSRYALIVGRDNARRQSITTKLLHLKEGGRCPTFDLRVHEVVDKIFECERDLGFLDSDPRRNKTSFSGNSGGFNQQSNQGQGMNQNQPNVAAISVVSQQLQALQQQLQQLQQNNQQPSFNNQYPNQQSNSQYSNLPQQSNQYGNPPSGPGSYSNPQPPSTGTLSQLLANVQQHANHPSQDPTPHPPPMPYSGGYGSNAGGQNPQQPSSTAQLANLSKLLSTLQQNQQRR